MAKEMTETDNKKNGSIQSIERAIDVLNAIGRQKRAVSVLELQQDVGLSRPTLYRLLQTLAGKDMIRAFGEPRRFVLGPGIMALAHAWMTDTDVVELARPLLEDLRDHSNETAALFVLREDRRHCVLEMVSRNAIAMARGIGETEHVSLGASGKAMLAFVPPTDLRHEKLWAGVPEKIDRSELEAELEEARRLGYAVSRGEKFRGALAIAAPVFDHAGHVQASVALYGPETRFDDERLKAGAALAAEAARHLSAQLGYRPEPAA
jgi:IclR family acetate operon transcriptional repressor